MMEENEVHEAEIVAEEDEERVEDDEVVIAYPQSDVKMDEEEALIIAYDSLKWLSKLEKLEKILREELVVKPWMSDVINDELREVRREVERTLWRLGRALSSVKLEGEVPQELINRAREAARGSEPKGPTRPWLIVELLRRYKV
ncbi:hypothetical protein [Ignicoccus hospitalis]|uniref:Uncharacterized protein n=1 Tax=Ignicoccus hospitalis (strain KIN4/I / DSM 18386 / JCM 14125) TaxID=453591 RepID=A8A8E2_IGNH4|nr:hypothetical protein [Ignicoccus hospitalis]ABU81194.1 hypothetical protein Igni_0010 [Ignicoccus hospitalis KIN4/I]HIH90624.1 hypothetical protein [Desulfurococcaceae archaeon]